MNDAPRLPLTGAAIGVAPMLVLGYAAVRLLDPGGRPGLAWTASHLLLLAAFVMFGLAIPGIGQTAARGGRTRRVVAVVTAVVAAVGVFCAFGQTLTDIAVGLIATDRAGMNVLFHQIHSYPGVGLAFGSIGPILFFVGLPALTALLAAARPPQMAAWGAVAVAVGALLPVATLDLLPLAAFLMTLGLAPLGWRLTHATRLARSPVPASEPSAVREREAAGDR